MTAALDTVVTALQALVWIGTASALILTAAAAADRLVGNAVAIRWHARQLSHHAEHFANHPGAHAVHAQPRKETP